MLVQELFSYRSSNQETVQLEAASMCLQVASFRIDVDSPMSYKYLSDIARACLGSQPPNFLVTYLLFATISLISFICWAFYSLDIVDQFAGQIECFHLL